MKLARRVVYDKAMSRWNILAEEPSPAGLFRLQTAVEQMFSGAKVAQNVRVVDGLCFAMAEYSDQQQLDTLGTDTFNEIVGTFDPVRKLAAAGGFEVQAKLIFEPTQDFCDRLGELMGPGVGRVRVSPLLDCLLSIPVNDLDGDTDVALTVADIDDLLHRLLCCTEQK